MKKCLLVVFPLLVVLSCNKVQDRRMTVVRDCTGTYLRMNGKDYQVCNRTATNNFPAGTAVKVSFKAVGDCNEEPEFVCEMLHPSEGWIKIVSIEEE